MDSRRRYFTKAACHIISMATAGHPALRVRARSPAALWEAGDAETGDHRFCAVDVYARRVHGLRGEGDRLRADGAAVARAGDPGHPSLRQNAGAAPRRSRTVRIEG